jgi:uncharacterized protein (DUF983 family)
MSDQCPACSDGILHITDTTRISWVGVCDVCGTSVEISDYEIEPDPPVSRYLLHAGLIVVLSLIAAHFEVML